MGMSKEDKKDEGLELLKKMTAQAKKAKRPRTK